MTSARREHRVVSTLLLFLSAVVLSSCSKSTGPASEVVVYCAQDQVYAEPVFRDFEQEHGIPVRAVYDSEVVKTVGIANRLIAEKSNPQCDVFWGNEEMRTRQLAARDLFRRTNGVASFGIRTRRLVVNTNRLAPRSAPASLMELTNATWRGKIAIAYPQFGTTATHFHALRQLWGPELWNAWCRGLAANQPFLVDGNSAVVSVVGRGDAWLGLTDSDDIAAGLSNGYPLAPGPLTRESLAIPNTVAVVRGAPHPEAAEKLFRYLQRPETAKRLVTAHALETEAPDPGAPGVKPDWDALLANLEVTTVELSQAFMR